MSIYHHDGSVWSTSIPRGATSGLSQANGLRLAVVVATYRALDERNIGKVGVECDVVLYEDRRPLFNVPVLHYTGVANADLWEPQPTRRNLVTGETLAIDITNEDNPLSAPTQPVQLKDLDGDHVVIAFVDGRTTGAVITGCIPHPSSIGRHLPVTAPVVGTLAHPATPGGGARYLEHSGTRLQVDERGNVVVDTVEAGTLNGADDVTGSTPMGTLFVQIRANERLVVLVGGQERYVIEGGAVRIAGGGAASARVGDDVQVTMPAEWVAWLSGCAAAAGYGSPVPTAVIPGTITTGSTQVQVGG